MCDEMPTTLFTGTTSQQICPYLGYDNFDILCDLWEQVDALQQTSTTAVESSTVTGTTETTSTTTNFIMITAGKVLKSWSFLEIL